MPLCITADDSIISGQKISPQQLMQKSVKLKDFLFYLLSGNFLEMNKYYSEKLGRSTLQKMPNRKHGICRTYCSGNEKKIKAAKESEIKHVSGTINKLIVKKIVLRSRNQIVSHLVSSRIKICTIYLYLLCKLLNKLHHRLPWASSVIQIPRGKTTDLMVALSKIFRILRLGPNVFQQLSEIL